MRLVRIMGLMVLCLLAASSMSCDDDDDDEVPEPQEPGVDAGGGGADAGGGGTVVDVMVRDNVFDPAEVTVSAGTTVRWTQAGVNEHSVTSGDSPAQAGAGSAFDMDLDTPGETFEVTFDQPGDNPYHCKYHFFSDDMAGRVTVE